MTDPQDEMGAAQRDIELANEALAKAIRDRRAIDRDSPMVNTLDKAVTAAKNALTVAELKLRRIYEAKDDGG